MTVVRSVQQLESLPRDRRVNGLLIRDTVTLRLPDVATADQIRWEKTLNRHQHRCGCVAGSVCMLTALVVGGSELIQSTPALMSREFIVRAMLLFIAATAIGLAGKFIALAVTRFQFSHTCMRLLKEVSVLHHSADRAFPVEG